MIGLEEVFGMSEEYSCSKCGEPITEGDYDNYDGLCGNCYEENNEEM